MRLALTALLLFPFGASAGEGGFDHTHAAFDAFLGSAVTAKGVDYGALKSRRAGLDGYVTDLGTADLSTFGPGARKAFWINAYNALTIQLILDEGVPDSIMGLDGGNVWKTRTFTVAGGSVTLDAMEQTIIRPMGDARAHAALNCASKGCPPLPPDPLTAGGVDAELDAASRRWASSNAYVLNGSDLKLSHVFEWYAADFTSSEASDVAGADDAQDAAIHFLVPFAGDDAEKLKSGTLTVGWNPYDWALNKR